MHCTAGAGGKAIDVSPGENRGARSRCVGLDSVPSTEQRPRSLRMKPPRPRSRVAPPDWPRLLKGARAPRRRQLLWLTELPFINVRPHMQMAKVSLRPRLLHERERCRLVFSLLLHDLSRTAAGAMDGAPGIVYG